MSVNMVTGASASLILSRTLAYGMRSLRQQETHFAAPQSPSVGVHYPPSRCGPVVRPLPTFRINGEVVCREPASQRSWDRATSGRFAKMPAGNVTILVSGRELHILNNGEPVRLVRRIRLVCRIEPSNHERPIIDIRGDCSHPSRPIFRSAKLLDYPT